MLSSRPFCSSSHQPSVSPSPSGASGWLILCCLEPRGAPWSPHFRKEEVFDWSLPLGWGVVGQVGRAFLVGETRWEEASRAAPHPLKDEQRHLLAGGRGKFLGVGT